MTGGERVTYRSVLANREFAAILFSQTLSILGDQISRIALAILIYSRTNSAFGASAVFAVSYLTYLVGGAPLSALADRFDRRSVMVVSDLARATVVGVLGLWQPGTAGVFALLIVLSLLAPAFDSARGATLPDILPGDAYPRGSALANLLFQGAQIGGFVAGGALLASTSARQALLIDAATFLVSAGFILAALRERRLPERTEHSSLLEDTREGLRVVSRSLPLRSLLGFALVGAAVVSAPESLAVPVSASLGEASFGAGLLTAAIPAGFILGSFFVLRYPADKRRDLLPVLVIVSAVPLLATPWVSSLTLMVTMWVLSGTGSALQLIASAAYVTAAPEEVRGRAYGLASTSLMAVQGLVQLTAGGTSALIGSRHGADVSIAIVAGAAVLAVSPLARAERSSRLGAQGKPDIGR